MLSNRNNSDMNRDVWCVLGLPFDALNMNSVIDKVHDSAINDTPLFLSTPNLNFLISSQIDDEFRNSVINSDLSVMDGKPLVWVAKLLKIPVPERIAGSNLIENLIDNKKGYKPLSVFFFGGEEGVAGAACNKLKKHPAGLRCAGFFNPGFGSIEDMSSDEIINQIRESRADFIIVSLGAKKGQAWIEMNREYLNCSVISHLGAVVNFIAGNVKRSPIQLQKLGLEWLWRIKEEPALWRRYFSDGMKFMCLLMFKVIPYSIFIRLQENRNMITESEIKLTENYSESVLDVKGCFDSNICDLTQQALEKAVSNCKDVTLNISNGSYIGSKFIGKLFMLEKCLHNEGCRLKVKTKSRLIRKIFYYNNCEYMLDT